MRAKLVLGTFAVIGAIAVASPAFARHWGLDVAPGGGYYTRGDVANESPRRMSHPFVGEPRAPSAVARGPHRYVSRFEMGLTAALNMRQLRRRGW